MRVALSDALTLTLSHRAEGSPQINASTEQSPRPSGERVRVREHTAVVVIPFTLCSLLLCNDMTGERAGVAQSPPPRRPVLPAVNRRFAVPSAYSFRLIGYGRRQRPCKAALSAHPCASPRPEGKRLSDLQPDRGIADSPQSFRKQLYCFCIKNYWGSLSPQGEGTNPKNGNEVAVLLYFAIAFSFFARSFFARLSSTR